jgi:hypothetical protein
VASILCPTAQERWRYFSARREIREGPSSLIRLAVHLLPKARFGAIWGKKREKELLMIQPGYEKSMRIKFRCKPGRASKAQN